MDQRIFLTVIITLVLTSGIIFLLYINKINKRNNIPWLYIRILVMIAEIHQTIIEKINLFKKINL